MPHIWPELAQHYSKHSPPRRNKKLSAEARCEKEKKAAQKQEADEKEKDRVISIEDIRSKVQESKILGGGGML